MTHFELELELIQTNMAQKPVLRVEVGARALRVRSVRICGSKTPVVPLPWGEGGEERGRSRLFLVSWVNFPDSAGMGYNSGVTIWNHKAQAFNN